MHSPKLFGQRIFCFRFFDSVSATTTILQRKKYNHLQCRRNDCFDLDRSTIIKLITEHNIYDTKTASNEVEVTHIVDIVRTTHKFTHSYRAHTPNTLHACEYWTTFCTHVLFIHSFRKKNNNTTTKLSRLLCPQSNWQWFF